MQILLAVLLAYSTFIKPSFLTIYLPACVVLVLMRLISYARFRCGRGKKDPQMPAGECSAGGRGGIVSYAVSLLVDHLYFVPSGLLLLRQYVLKFQTEEAAASSGVAIRLFKAAGRYTPSIALSWVLRMAFPAAVILIWHRSIRKNRLFWLILAEYVFGQLIAFVFTETGSRATHGNFGWGNLLGTSLIWIFCLVFFVQQYLTEGAENPATGSQKGPQGAASAGTGEIGLPSLCSRFGKWRWKYVLPALLLIWHLSAGIVYYVTLLHTPDLQL